MKRLDKKGDIKWNILISLILGIMVLGLSLFFIFNEYFNEDELDWQLCRESLLLRANAPDLESLGTSTKGAFPIKCKTEVVTIDTADRDEVHKKISDTVAAGWYLFGEGEWDFIAPNIFSERIICMAFARIHYTDSAIEEFKEANPAGGEVSRYNLAFENFYKGTKLGNSKSTYDGYLPLVHQSAISLGGAPSNAFVPISTQMYPHEGDDILVYSRHKKPAIFTADWFDWSELLDRSIVMVSPDELNDIGCDEFLTIPA